MATIALALLKKYWKVLLVLLVIAALALACRAEYNHIVQIGYAQGFAAGQADKQKVIDQMLAQESADNKALNDKIKGLEDASATYAATEFALRAKVQTATASVITKYVQVDKDSQTCGMDAAGADAINEMLDADPAIVTPEAK